MNNTEKTDKEKLKEESLKNILSLLAEYICIKKEKDLNQPLENCWVFNHRRIGGNRRSDLIDKNGAYIYGKNYFIESIELKEEKFTERNKDENNTNKENKEKSENNNVNAESNKEFVKEREEFVESTKGFNYKFY